MAVNLEHPTQVLPINGIRLACASAGIKYQGRDDVVLIEINDEAEIAAVFTQNKFCAAPVEICKNNLQQTKPKYLIINAGNANAGTGKLGMEAAQATTQYVADQMSVSPNQVLPFSTGVIGEVLDAEKINTQLSQLKKNLSQQNWLSAAKAIMTTDTIPKAYSHTITISGHEIAITGICKGSGMIQPNMATMLAYVATDLTIDKTSLEKLLLDCAGISFNAITVDSDTSTNDSCVLISTGNAKIHYSDLTPEDKKIFDLALKNLMQKLAHAIVRDGEGASKFVTVKVTSAESMHQARNVAFSVANSPLVKTALSASDPNWGRILAAAGKCNDASLNLSNVSLYMSGIQVVDQGELASSYTEELGKQAVVKDEIELLIDLNLGREEFCVWTTDLTHEYISINADYRS